MAMQVPVLLIAAWMIFDGLVGPQLAPKNLATVGVWLHYRGLVVLALLLAGNLFCMACPFMLTRRLGRWVREHLLRGGRPVPRWMKNKWIAVALIVVFFFAYEIFALWASPWWTAWVAIGYFAIALAVDTLFRGAAFCKHVCPLGHFNFFGSLVSPLEIQVRDGDVCAACPTKDCITAHPVSNSPGLGDASRGEAGMEDASMGDASMGDASILSGATEGSAVEGRPIPATVRTPAAEPVAETSRATGARGCELALFQPRKVGNMDCTFCLDCIHACPYDNIGMVGRAPARELWRDPWRSGIGRFSDRPDLAALVVVLTFGAFLNAFAMIRPVYALQEGLGRLLGTAHRAPGLVLIFAIGLVVLPALLLAAAALLTRLQAPGASVRAIVGRYVWTLAPMGFGMWLAHYAFHFLTGALTVVPVIQSFLADVGLSQAAPRWDLGPIVPLGWVFPIEAALLYGGATLSIITAVQVAQDHMASVRPAARGEQGRGAAMLAARPWIGITLLMLGFGIWIMLQPMEMRGTMLMTGGG